MSMIGAKCVGTTVDGIVWYCWISDLLTPYLRLVLDLFEFND